MNIRQRIFNLYLKLCDNDAPTLKTLRSGVSLSWHNVMDVLGERMMSESGTNRKERKGELMEENE